MGVTLLLHPRDDGAPLDVRIHGQPQLSSNITTPIGTAWNNAECRSYTFESPEDDDEHAYIIETDESWTRRKGVGAKRLSKDEQRQLKRLVLETLGEAIETDDDSVAVN